MYFKFLVTQQGKQETAYPQGVYNQSSTESIADLKLKDSDKNAWTCMKTQRLPGPKASS